MNLYLAATATNQMLIGQTTYNRLEEGAEKLPCTHAPHLLESYHYITEKITWLFKEHGYTVFLDSGAFSAKSLGVDIPVEEYARYIIDNRNVLRHEDGVALASVLDCIGDAEGTFNNQKKIEAMGATCLPCYHYGEDPSYLVRYLDGYPYITIGGLVGRKASDVILWLDDIWRKYLLRSDGTPRIKVHAFGVTTVSIMERYPWHSVDSSSWVQVSSFGGILFVDNGKAKTLSISAESPNRKTQGAHYDTLSQEEQTHIRSVIEGKGYTLERLQNNYWSRHSYNMTAYIELGALLTARHAEGRYGVLAIDGLF